jgi:putative membrane protein
MGMGDAVPGVSGGTIALITGIYPRLLLSIGCFDLTLLRLLLQRQWRASWQHVQGGFLLLLGSGILSGLLLSANTVLLLLESQRQPLMGLFVGLVLASAFTLLGHSDWTNWRCWLAALAGLALTALVALLNPLGLPPTLPNLFIGGLVAISAMILPGLSGAFILLLLGLYEPVLDALVSRQWLQILVFALGCGLGLLAFSRLLSWLLDRYSALTYAWVWGLLLGSLQILWPWRLADPAQPALTRPVSPLHPEVADPQLALTMVAALFGVVLVLALQFVVSRNPAKG